VVFVLAQINVLEKKEHQYVVLISHQRLQMQLILLKYAFDKESVVQIEEAVSNILVQLRVRGIKNVLPPMMGQSNVVAKLLIKLGKIKIYV